GHGPYGHFFDDHYLSRFDLTHEDVGQRIITTELATVIRGIRANPNGRLEPHESLQPEQIAYLIKRPAADPPSDVPQPASGGVVPSWLRLLRSLFSGVYTVDNMDFVLRDRYMSGHSTWAFD